MNIIHKMLLILSILLLISCSEENNPTEPEHEHFKAYGLILESNGNRVLTYFNLKTNDTLYVPIGLTDHYEVKFLSADSSIIPPPTDIDKKLGWVISDTSMLEVYRHGEEWEFHLKGKKVGTTSIEFQVLHNDHPDFRTIKIPVVVRDQSGQHGAPIGVRAYIEDTNELICESYVIGSNKLTKGEFKLKVGDSTDHIVLKFFDEANIEFQPSIGHKLLIEFASNEICKSIPAGDDEPWAFKLYGIAKGITQVVFKIAGSDEKIHVEFLPIYVKVE